jgi:hypothetical protein
MSIFLQSTDGNISGLINTKTANSVVFTCMIPQNQYCVTSGNRSSVMNLVMLMRGGNQLKQEKKYVRRVPNGKKDGRGRGLYRLLNAQLVLLLALSFVFL